MHLRERAITVVITLQRTSTLCAVAKTFHLAVVCRKTGDASCTGAGTRELPCILVCMQDARSRCVYIGVRVDKVARMSPNILLKGGWWRGEGGGWLCSFCQALSLSANIITWKGVW